MTEKTLIPVGGIRIQNGDNSIVFMPSDDITAKEVALIFQMFLNGVMHRGEHMLDFGAFIISNNLQKHFVAVAEEKTEQ